MVSAITLQKLYKAFQSPSQWLSQARSLASAAEVILSGEAKAEEHFADAFARAEAELEGLPSDRSDRSVTIKAPVPNYAPAQLLYGFAIENALKGLLVALNPALASEGKLDSQLKTHDLWSLAKGSGISLSAKEEEFLVRLTHFIEWGGRYPVGADRDSHMRAQHLLLPSNEMLGDWATAHAALRKTFERVIALLEAHVPERSDFSILVEVTD